MFDWKKYVYILDADGVYNAFWNNKKYIGFFVKDVDGYYVFMSHDDGGATNALYHKVIAAALEELDHDWDIIVTDDLGEQPPLPRMELK